MIAVTIRFGIDATTHHVTIVGLGLKVTRRSIHFPGYQPQTRSTRLSAPPSGILRNLRSTATVDGVAAGRGVGVLCWIVLFLFLFVVLARKGPVRVDRVVIDVTASTETAECENETECEYETA